MRTYKFKLYQSKKNRHLKRQINISAVIYNHCIALHKRYYRLYGKHLNVYALKKHITKLKKLDKHAFWKQVGSPMFFSRWMPPSSISGGGKRLSLF